MQPVQGSSTTPASRLILAAILINFVYGMITALLGTILPALSSRLHLTPEQNGSAALAQAAGMIVASLATGILIDYRGVKIGLVLGLGTIMIALLSLTQASAASGVVVAIALLGLGGGVQVTAGNAFVNAISDKLRAALFNLLLMFFGLGGLVTPFIAANLLPDDPARLSYIAAAMTAATLAMVISIRVPS